MASIIHHALLLGASYSIATAANLDDENTKRMLTKLVSVRLHIGKMVMSRADNGDEVSEAFLGVAKSAVMMLVGRDRYCPPRQVISVTQETRVQNVDNMIPLTQETRV